MNSSIVLYDCKSLKNNRFWKNNFLSAYTEDSPVKKLYTTNCYGCNFVLAEFPPVIPGKDNSRTAFAMAVNDIILSEKKKDKRVSS